MFHSRVSAQKDLIISRRKQNYAQMASYFCPKSENTMFANLALITKLVHLQNTTDIMHNNNTIHLSTLHINLHK